MAPGNETKGTLPFIPLILSKVNSYEDAVNGKFKSPCSTLQLFACSSLHFWQNTRISFSRWAMGFSDQARQSTSTRELFMGCCRMKKKNQISSPNVWLNVHINNSYNNPFVSSFVNPAIHNNFQGNCRVGLGTTISGFYKRMGTRIVKITSLWFEIFCHKEEKCFKRGQGGIFIKRQWLDWLG